MNFEQFKIETRARNHRPVNTQIWEIDWEDDGEVDALERHWQRLERKSQAIRDYSIKHNVPLYVARLAFEEDPSVEFGGSNEGGVIEGGSNEVGSHEEGSHEGSDGLGEGEVEVLEGGEIVVRKAKNMTPLPNDFIINDSSSNDKEEFEPDDADGLETDLCDALGLLDEVLALGDAMKKQRFKPNGDLRVKLGGLLDSVELFLDGFVEYRDKL